MAARRLNTSNLVTIVSVAILVGTEILGAALAVSYAVSGLFEFGREVGYALDAVALLAGLWAIWRFVKVANRVEPVFEADAF